jgi:TetR/AcrR family transcriptional regulator
MVGRSSKPRKQREPRRPGRPRADEANQRERLLDAAVACFAAEGIGATSLRGIALKAGVTPALINYYFGSKERLLEAFLAERITPVIATLRESLSAAGSEPRALVTAFVSGIHAAVARFPWWPALWVREVLSDNGALREVLIKQISPQVAQVVAKTLAGAQRRGELSAALDPRLLVVSLVGLTLFPLAAESIWRRVFAADDIDHAALQRHTLALLDHGLGGAHAH